MRRRFLVQGFVIIVCGMGLGLAVPLANSSSDRQNNIRHGSSAFEPAPVTHQTRIELQTTPGFSTPLDMPAQNEIEIPAPTCRSFMASWEGASDAVGYLLDVSTNSSFSSYVEGYHNLDVGNMTGRVVTGLNPGTTYYYRVRAYNASGAGRYSDLVSVTTVATTGLTIHPTFDSSILNNPNAAAIEAMINRAIAIYESLFSDPITIEILFRYSTTGPDGTPLGQGTLSQSDSVIYGIPWDTFISSLRTDAKTSNDTVANASLPGNALSATIKPKGPNGRAVGLDTPPSMFANGTVGNGGPFDGIVTLNSSSPFQFTRPVSASNFDAQNATEHEIDEIIAFGSNAVASNLRVQDLFSWSSAGVRNITTSGARYFSINGGATNIVNFNQDQTLDLGDWLSAPCPQAHPYVQNAAGCRGQSSDISATSPEGINLDVIGFDLVVAPAGGGAGRASVRDFNGDGHPDWVLQSAGTRQTAIWYLNNNVLINGVYGPTLAAGWRLRALADFNGDNHSDYALFSPGTDQTALWYLSGPTLIGSAYGPTVPRGWELVGTADFNGDGHPDYVLYNGSTHQTAIWYLNNNVLVGGAFGPSIPAGWTLVGTADFNRDGHPDYALFNPGTGQTAIWYLSGPTLLSGAFGPTVPAGWALVAGADFNGDGKPDYLLYNANSRQTALWYLNNNVYVSGAYGPTLPAGWSLVGQ